MAGYEEARLKSPQLPHDDIMVREPRPRPTLVPELLTFRGDDKITLPPSDEGHLGAGKCTFYGRGQTDRLGLVFSDYAVLDRDAHRYLSFLGLSGVPGPMSPRCRSFPPPGSPTP